MAIGGARIRVESHCEGRSPGRDLSGLAYSRKAVEKFYVRGLSREARDIPPFQTYIFDLTTEMLTLDANVNYRRRNSPLYPCDILIE